MWFTFSSPKSDPLPLIAPTLKERGHGLPWPSVPILIVQPSSTSTIAHIVCRYRHFIKMPYFKTYFAYLFIDDLFRLQSTVGAHSFHFDVFSNENR